MKTIYKRIVKKELNVISEIEFKEMQKSTEMYWTAVESTDSDPRFKKDLKYAFMSYYSAVDLAFRKNMIVVSRMLQYNGMIYFLMYNPHTNEYFQRTETKERVLTAVTNEEYNHCLLEIKSQKESDKSMKWFPANEDYYSIENWTF